MATTRGSVGRRRRRRRLGRLGRRLLRLLLLLGRLLRASASASARSPHRLDPLRRREPSVVARLEGPLAAVGVAAAPRTRRTVYPARRRRRAPGLRLRGAPRCARSRRRSGVDASGTKLRRRHPRDHHHPSSNRTSNGTERRRSSDPSPRASDRRRTRARRRAPASSVGPSFCGLGVVVFAPPRDRARSSASSAMAMSTPPSRPACALGLRAGHRATPRSFATLRIARAASNGDAADRAPPPRRLPRATAARRRVPEAGAPRADRRSGCTARGTRSRRPRRGPGRPPTGPRRAPSRTASRSGTSRGRLKRTGGIRRTATRPRRRPWTSRRARTRRGRRRPGRTSATEARGSRRVRSSSRASAEEAPREPPRRSRLWRSNAARLGVREHRPRLVHERGRRGGAGAGEVGVHALLNGAPGGAELGLGRARVRVEDEVVIDEPEAVGDVGGGRSRGGRRVVRGGESRHRGAPAGANARARENARARASARASRARRSDAPSATGRGGRAEGGVGRARASRPDDEKARARDRKARQQPRPDDLFILLTTTTRIPRASAVPRAWA